MKKPRIIRYVLLMMMSSVLFAACQYETLELNKCTDVSYSIDIQPVFDEKCVSCHGSGGGIAGLDFTSENSYNELIDGDYVNLDSPEESVIYTYAKNNHNGANASDACLLLGWIDEGAAEN